MSGLIIDTFSALREEGEFRDDYLNNYCFICGIHR